MQHIEHSFENFDPLASSLLTFPGILDAKMAHVFVPSNEVDFDTMVWAASKVLSASAISSEIDGPTMREFDDAVKRASKKAEDFRAWLINLKPEQKIWTQSGTRMHPQFHDADFTWIVDIYSTIVVEEFPSNPDWQLELEACVPPLALAVLVLTDRALSLLAENDRAWARSTLVTADSLSARSRQIPKMLSRSPQTLSTFGGIAKNKVNRQMAQFARERYAIRNVDEKFANRRVAAQAIRADVEAEALRHGKVYSDETFGETLYKWLLAK